MCDVGEGAPERGPYESWRSTDPWHVAFIRLLSQYVHDAPEARLWLAVIEQALVDEFVLKGTDMDPEDHRWSCGVGSPRRFFRSRLCGEVCEAIGIDRRWFRSRLALYAEARRGAGR